MNISVAVIALNEEKNIRECLDTVRWADDIVVVDSGSADSTVDISGKRGACVFKREFDDFAKQKNFAVSKTEEEWVFFLDADERVTPELGEEIRKAVENDHYDGYYIPRNNIIFGKHLKYGGHQKDRHIRLFRKSVSSFINPVHEKVVVDGPVGNLKNPIIHYSTETIGDYIEKLNNYSTLEAGYLIEQGSKIGKYDIILRPFMVFFRRYFIYFGFLDGFEGFMFYLLSGINVFVKYAKYFELINAREGADS